MLFLLSFLINVHFALAFSPLFHESYELPSSSMKLDLHKNAWLQWVKASPKLSSMYYNRRSSSLSLSNRIVETTDQPNENRHEIGEPDTKENQRNDSGLILPSHPDTPIHSVMAPMVSASDYPFRHFLQKYNGIDLVYTQMLHAKNIVTMPKFRKCHFDFYETGMTYPTLLQSQHKCIEGLAIPPSFLDEHNIGDGANSDPQDPTSVSPLIVQLAGDNVDLVVKAATLILDHTIENKCKPVSGIDLNLGCPQAIARKGNYGAFLMEKDFDQVCKILKQLRREIPSSTAVSAKIRLPTDDDTLKERIPRLIETGINFLTIHGRTLHENKTKVGRCHAERIALAVETAHKLNPNFPIVANGGMEDYDDVQSMLQSTGAVAAMSSEALLETPNLFVRTSKELTPRQLLDQQLSFARDYLQVCATVAPPLPFGNGHGKGGSSAIMRGHLLKFLHRYLQQHMDLCQRMANAKDGVQNILEAQTLIDELQYRYDLMSDSELDACPSSSPDASWYRRHRKPERRVNQKEVKIESSLSPSSTTTSLSKEESLEDLKERIKSRLKKMKKDKKKLGKQKVV